MNDEQNVKLLFIINPGSGTNSTDWSTQIEQHFAGKAATVNFVQLDESCSPQPITDGVEAFKPDRVIAVGGDGTVKLVATCMMNRKIPLGILPAGSANGMAKELGIPVDTTKALEIIEQGATKGVHVVKINDEICIHLADIGFNAFVVKKFEREAGRGMWGYIKAAWKVLWEHPRMDVDIRLDGQSVKRKAAMVVIANATKYGSGALINPEGKLDDDVFELIIVKKVSLGEIFKMMVTHSSYHSSKTELYQTSWLQIRSRIKAHFQVDGEYLGKINDIEASIIPNALQIIVPGN